MRIHFYLLPALMSLTACSGSSNSPSSNSNTALSEFEFLDPNASADNKFGITVVELANGNIAIRSNDSSVATNNGAVHLYNPESQNLIASFYGDGVDDHLGSSYLTPLSNGNLVITTAWDDTGSINSGSVMLINGETGQQIGNTIEGPGFVDFIGEAGITELSNGNFVIASSSNSPSGTNNAGAIRLINGNTGTQIGSTVYGESQNSRFGYQVNTMTNSASVVALTNGNFVVPASDTDVASGGGTLSNAGKVTLFDGTTGQVIDTPITGDNDGDRIGRSGVYPLDNGNYVIASSFDSIGGNFATGSAILVNGSTGVQIGASMTGDSSNDQFAVNGIVPLSNNEFLISSTFDSVPGFSQAGSIDFFNANTAVSIGLPITGTAVGERLGTGNPIFQMPNGNIVVSSVEYDFVDFTAGISLNEIGRIVLIDGSTKTQVASIEGTTDFDRLGSSGVKGLGNGNFAVVSEQQDHNGNLNAGSIMVFNGNNGQQVGSTIFGDNAGDSLGQGGVTVLSNGNFVVASPVDDVNGIINAGSVMLINGLSGALIATVSGDNIDDYLGLDSITALSNGNFIIASSQDDVNGIVNAGSILLIDGTTGGQIGNAESGDDTNDQYGKIGTLGNNLNLQFDNTGVTPLSTGNYVISAQFNDSNGETDIGFSKYKLGQ